MNDAHRDEIAKLEALYAMNPEGRVFTHLAEACRKAGQLERAREILEDGLQRHPDYASAHVVLGRVLADSGEDGNAAAEFRRVLELDRHNLVALRSLGELAARSERLDEALHYYGELAVLDPTDSGLQDELRELRERAGHTAEAVGSASGSGQAATSQADAPDGSAVSTEPASDGPAEVERADEDADGEPSPVESTSAAWTAEPAAFTGYEERFERLDGTEYTSMGAGGHADEGADEAESAPQALDQPVESAGDEPAEPAGEAAPVSSWLAVDGTAGEPEAGADLEMSLAEPTDDEAAAEVIDGEFVLEEESIESFEIELAPEFQAPLPADALEPALEASWEHVPDTGDLILEDEADETATDTGEAGRAADETVEVAPSDVAAASGEDAEPDSGAIEGRWDEPGTIAAERQAERISRPDDTGEWIPAERWEWVAASADTSSSTVNEASDSTQSEEADTESASESSSAGDWMADADIEAGTAADYDPETSFADLNPESVDSFEAGAAAVMDAFVRAGEADQGLEVEAEFEEASAEIELEEEVFEEAADQEPAGADHATHMDGTAAETLETMDLGLEPIGAPSDWPGGSAWTASADDDSGDQVITETLAEIYASQGLYDRAAAVYRRLVEQNPGDERLAGRLSDLETATGWTEPGAPAGGEAEETEAFLSRVESAWTGAEGAAGVDDSPYAWSPESADPEVDAGPRVGDYFSTLLAWRPGQALPSTEAMESEPPGAGAVEGVGGWFSDRDAATGEADDVGREGEEDLEMFRSWLKSLKK